jgi:hypothetical protein
MTLVLTVGILGVVVALGDVQEKSSYGLLVIIGCLAYLAKPAIEKPPPQ